MELSLDMGNAEFRITSYQPGSVVINGQVYTCSLWIMPDRLIAPWAPRKVSELTSEHFQEIAALNPTVVILGTGTQFQSVHPAIFSAFYEKKIGVEIMDSAAAARTYTILMAEGRKVAAGLLLNSL